MFLLIFFLICLFAVAGTGVLAALSDLRGMSIPNMYSGAIIGAFLLCYAVLWFGGRDDVFGSLFSHGLGVVIVFLITLVMFMMGAIGGGDAKLASAFAFWTGLKGLVPLVFYMSLVGGILGLAALALRKWTPVKAPEPDSWIARVQGGESKVPYGVAIVVGALVSFLKIGYFDVEVLSSFLIE